jgi:hypothetical protein
MRGPMFQREWRGLVVVVVVGGGGGSKSEGNETECDKSASGLCW